MIFIIDRCMYALLALGLHDLGLETPVGSKKG
jgi:hypothetical protein